MELDVYWSELAKKKLKNIYDYYSLKANRKVAQKLINGIVDATIGIEAHPEMGQVEINLEHRKQEFRYLVFRDYKIIYWINSEYKRIEIANVFATKQNPKKMDEI
ncbi:MAG: type II toxin-antitoxin system RelE/ParE family toxin [Bacteroidota bacterium]